MHSRIFQVSREPITEENYISECRYDDYFVGQNGVDYVVESDNKQDDLNWLRTANKGIEVTENTIKVTSKKEYFEKSFEEFQEYVEKFNNYNMEDFIDPKNWLDFYRFKDAYDSTDGFKIDDNDEYFGITSLDNFVRNVEEGKVYYIGKTFDYHF